MAHIYVKDPNSFTEERECFLKELHQFHETRGTPFKRGPKISGRRIDLYMLYLLVIDQGGWVSGKNDWNKIIEDLSLPLPCVNCSIAIKQIYLRYLDRYEKVHYLGETGDRVTEEDEESRHRNWSMRALHSIPLSYNHAQHNVTESQRIFNGLSLDLYKPSDYDGLALSLLSPLVNEQDFAIGVCTMLSHKGKNSLKLEKHPRILHYLLAHAAVFSHSSLSTLFCETYSQIRGHSLTRFWHDVLFDSGLKRLVDENFDESLLGENSSEKEDESSAKSSLTINPEDKLLFCLGRTLGTQEYIGQRVLEIAGILRNLTFIPENVMLMSGDYTFVRFVVLCCGSQWNSLQQMGWDMLGNLALDLTVHCPLMHDILCITLQGLESPDRARLLSSLEVLYKIGQNVKNEESLLKYIDYKVYERICSFLTIQDVYLVIYTLECMFSLTSLGEKACNTMLKVQGIVGTLVSLVTVESQSYGPDAYIQMKVVETVTTVDGVTNELSEDETILTSLSSGYSNVNNPGPLSGLSSGPSSATQVSSDQLQPVLNLSSASIPPLVPTTHVITQVQPSPSQVQQTQNQQSQTQLSQVQQSYVQQAQVQSHVVVPVTAANPLATQQVAQENEIFAFAWLRTAFENKPGACVEQQEMYKQYITYCAKVGRRGVISPHHFPRCVKSVFGVNMICGPSSSHDVGLQYYEGIQVRAKPLVSQNPSQASLPQTPSPILKAQLSAPPKPTSPSPQQNKALSQEPGGGCTPSGDQGTTSLIKSLLATKVTQRQQQQKLLQKNIESQHIMDENASNTSCLAALIGSNTSANEKPTASNISVAQPHYNKPSTSRVNGVPTLKRDHDQSESVPSTSSGVTHGKSLALFSLNNTNNSVKICLPSDDHEYAEASGYKKYKVCCVSDESSSSENNSNAPTSKNVMLTDLLEKSAGTNDPPSLNGALRFGDKGLELVQESVGCTISIPEYSTEAPPLVAIKDDKLSFKRAKEGPDNDDAKKPRLSENAAKDETPEEGNVSSSAANLYAALAADALEDEPVEELPEPPVLVATTSQPRQILVTTGGQLAQQVLVNGQQYVITQPPSSLLQGHPQTLLLAQTSQQHGSGAKTIIILQPQNVSSSTTQQKLLVPNFQSGPPPLISSSTSIGPKSPPINSSAPIIIQQPKIPTNISKSLPNSIFSNSTSNTAAGSTVIMSGMAPSCATPVNIVTAAPVVAIPASVLPAPVGSPAPSSSAGGPSTSAVSNNPPPKRGPYVCEWRGCMRSFKSMNEVYLHACNTHCPATSVDIACLWERCDGLKRKRFSHLTHLFDRHCNPDLSGVNIMRVLAHKKKQTPTSVVRIEPANQVQPFSHPGYGTNAAFNAIKRHNTDFASSKEVQEENETPITKSIRLTAALILRNLVVYSTNGRRLLTRFESQLANIAFSNVESSRTIAQVLYDMNNYDM